MPAPARTSAACSSYSCGDPWAVPTDRIVRRLAGDANLSAEIRGADLVRPFGMTKANWDALTREGKLAYIAEHPFVEHKE